PWRAGRALIVSTLAMTIALFIPYLDANRGFRRPLSECVQLLPRWNAWLAPGTFGPWAESMQRFSKGLVSEQYLFLGFTFLATVVSAAAVLATKSAQLGPARRRLAIICLLSAAALILI